MKNKELMEYLKQFPEDANINIGTMRNIRGKLYTYRTKGMIFVENLNGPLILLEITDKTKMPKEGVNLIKGGKR